MKKLKISYLVLFIALFAFVAAPFAANAQEDGSTDDAVIVDETAQIAEADALIALDEDVSAEDLDANPNQGFFSRFFDTVRLSLPVNPATKAEIRLKRASRKLLEVKREAEETGNTEKVEALLTDYNKEIDRIRDLTERIKENGGERAEKFVDSFLHDEVLHHKLVGRLEKNLPEETFERISEAKERIAGHISDIGLEFDNPDEFSARIERVMDRQKGSAFKNFKNLEVLKEVEERVPEQAREAIRRARDRKLEQLGDDLEGEGNERFEHYIRGVGGNEARHLEILDELGTRDHATPVRDIINKSKEHAIDRVGQRISNLNEENAGRFIRHLENGSVDNIRIINEIETTLPDAAAERVKKTKDRLHINIRTRFENASEEDLTRELERFHDVRQFGVFDELTDIVPEEKRAVLNGARSRATERLREEISSSPDSAARTRRIEKLSGDSPEHLDIIRRVAPGLGMEAETATRIDERKERRDDRQDERQDTRQDDRRDDRQDERQDTRQDDRRDDRQDERQDTRQDDRRDDRQDARQDERQDERQENRRIRR